MMKTKLFILGLTALFIASCDDNLNSVGSSILPENDKIEAFADSFQLGPVKTIKVDSIYAKTTRGLLGNFYDPLFGSLKADYMCQFYCPDDFKFKYEPINGVIDSVDFRIYYSSSLGDTLAPMQVKIYQITTPLTEDFYTNVDPAKYCNKQIVLGTKSYTAYDQTVPDSIRNQDGGYSERITVRFPKSFGQNFYDKSVSNPEYFKNQEKFNEFFPGLYVSSDYGIGNILFASSSYMYIYYRYQAHTTTSEGKDSTFVQNVSEAFSVTPEVIQLNHIVNTDMEELLAPNDRLSYIKTPAGVYTQITFPIEEMKKKVEGRMINNMALKFEVLPQDKWENALAPAPYVLLLPKDSIQDFFRENRVENGKTSFLSECYYKLDSYGNMTSTPTYTYNFKNISGLLKYQLDNNRGDIEMVLVPVERTTKTDYYNNIVTASLSNYLAPSGIKLVTDKKAMKIEVLSSKYKNQ